MRADNLIVLNGKHYIHFYWVFFYWGMRFENGKRGSLNLRSDHWVWPYKFTEYFLNKASPRRCPSLRKSLHALVNKPTLSAQCPASTQIQNKGQVTVVLDLWNFLYFINFMFVCIKLTERSNSDFLEETYTEKQFGEKQFENSRTRFTGTHLIPTTRYWLRSHLRRN